MPKNDPNKAFVWYSLRISFWIMILFWILATSFTSDISYTFSILFIIITLFTFVVSIIHLTKYKNKTFAIVSLIFSSIATLLFLIGVGVGINESISTSNIIFNETGEFVAKDYYDSLQFTILDYSYININFNSNNPSNVYLFTQNEFFRYENGENVYYVEFSEGTRYFNLENKVLSPDIYYVVIESIDTSVTYDISIESLPY